jgi:hypothetical protein
MQESEARWNVPPEQIDVIFYRWCLTIYSSIASCLDFTHLGQLVQKVLDIGEAGAEIDTIVNLSDDWIVCCHHLTDRWGEEVRIFATEYSNQLFTISDGEESRVIFENLVVLRITEWS